ncbi:TPA: hypothetical protein RI791_002076 [Vibrio cholerae]|nr:hypothetical protein [Vibrio cholerae]EGR2122124.1 hypothetical protein [Vibrio cholerae]HDV5544660.1 hypothetical protein [Vibrio cholerae]
MQICHHSQFTLLVREGRLYASPETYLCFFSGLQRIVQEVINKKWQEAVADAQTNPESKLNIKTSSEIRETMTFINNQLIFSDMEEKIQGMSVKYSVPLEMPIKELNEHRRNELTSSLLELAKQDLIKYSRYALTRASESINDPHLLSMGEAILEIAQSVSTRLETAPLH